MPHIRRVIDRIAEMSDEANYLLASGVRAGATSQAQAFANGIVTPVIRPATDGETAISLQTSSGDDVLQIDTTNKVVRIGVDGLLPVVDRRLVVYGGDLEVDRSFPGGGNAHIYLNSQTMGEAGLVMKNGGSDIGAIYAGSVHDPIGWAAGGGSGMAFYSRPYQGANTLRMMITGQGLIGINEFNPQAQLHVQLKNATTTGQIIQLAASQTANAFEVQDSAGTVLAAIDSAGTVMANNTGGHQLIVSGWDGLTHISDAGSGSIRVGADQYMYGNITYRKNGGEFIIANRWSSINSNVVIGTFYNNDFYRTLTVKTPDKVGINTNSPTATLHINLLDHTRIGQIIQLAASQAANAFEVQDYPGVILAAIDNKGGGRSKYLTVTGINDALSIGISLRIDPPINNYTSSIDSYWGLYVRDTFTSGSLSEWSGLVINPNNHAGSSTKRLYGAKFLSPTGDISTSYGIYIDDYPGHAIYTKSGKVRLGDQLHIQLSEAATTGQIIQLAASQAANAFEVQDSSGNALAAIDSTGAFEPASMADEDAPQNAIYFSTTTSKLAYKDASGTVHTLY